MHFKTKVYCPNSSLSFSIRNSRATGTHCYDDKQDIELQPKCPDAFTQRIDMQLDDLG